MEVERDCALKIMKSQYFLVLILICLFSISLFFGIVLGFEESEEIQNNEKNDKGIEIKILKEKIEEKIKKFSQKFLNFWQEMHEKIVQVWKEKGYSKLKKWLKEKWTFLKEEFKKEFQEINQDFKEIFEKKE